MAIVKKSPALLIVGLFTALMLAFFATPTIAEGAKYTSPTKIKIGSIKKIDINGGAKERVQLTKSTRVSNDIYYDTVKLKINGKTVKTLKATNIGQSARWSFHLIDFNKNDKYKELIVKLDYDNGAVTMGDPYYIFRYYGVKIRSIKATYDVHADGMYREYKNSSYVDGIKIRSIGNGRFQVKVNWNGEASVQKWITLKIDSKMKVKRI